MHLASYRLVIPESGRWNTLYSTKYNIAGLAQPTAVTRPVIAAWQWGRLPFGDLNPNITPGEQQRLKYCVPTIAMKARTHASPSGFATFFVGLDLSLICEYY